MQQAASNRSLKKKTNENDHSNSAFLQCAELILPWLTSLELANISLSCKTLNSLSKSITFLRSLDASRSFENIPIPFHNSVDDHPYDFFIYTPTRVVIDSNFKHRQCWGSNSISNPTPDASSVDKEFVVDELGESVSGSCNCEKCEEFECPCSNGFEDIVRECGPGCCCCGLECGNRLSQRRVSVRLKILRDEKKGWGLFADDFIQEGEFICEYAGELLTTGEARRRQKVYDAYALGGHFASALLVVREHLPSGNTCLRMNIDATRVGNVARFINHSCDGGNLDTRLVRSSGVVLARLCFYASRSIKKDEELTFSYGDMRVKAEGMRCFCGSSCCLGTLPSENT